MRSALTLKIFVTVVVLFFAVQVTAIDRPIDASKQNVDELRLITQLLRSGGLTVNERDAQLSELSVTLGDLALWQGIANAVVAGDRAYCWMYYGLQVVDISNTAAPVVLYEYLHPASELELAVVGNTLFALIPHEGLLVLDVTAAPVLLQTFPPVGTANCYGMDIQDNYLYALCQSVIDEHSGIEVFDISNPMAPILTAFENVPMLPINVDVVGNYAYVTDEWNLNVVDVTNKSDPQWLSKAACDGDAWDVKVRNNYAFVTNRQDSALLVLNVSDPRFPSRVTKLTLDTVSFWPTSIELRDHYAYIRGSSRIKIVDIASPTAPAIVGTWNTTGYGSHLQFDADQAHIPYWAEGLITYEMTDPLAPNEIWRYEIPGMGYDVELLGNYAIEANGIAGIQVIDISDPENLQVVAADDTPGDAMGIALRDNYAYVADSTLGLLIFDLSVPTAPSLLGSCETPGQARRVVVHDQYVYVAANDSGIAIVDVGNPALPTMVNRLPDPGILYLHLDNDRLYVSSWRGTVSIYDLTTPQAPALIANFAPGLSWNAGLAARGNYMFLAQDSDQPSRYGVLRVYDITDPQNPLPVADIDSVDFTREMRIVGDYLYLADYTRGVQVINIVNPEAPYRAGYFDTNPGWVWGLAVQGEVIYVAADNGFLSLYTGNCAGPDDVGRYNVSDAVFLISYIFGGGPAPDPLRLGDVNCDDNVSVSDAVYLINYIFAGGPGPCGGC